MIIFPAIDILDGKCVRLFKGDFNKTTVYENDPVKTAKDFESQGSKYLHIVDLDGAKNPLNRQSEIIKRIALETELNIQTGGGIRSEEQIKDYLDNGVSSVIVGSMAAVEPEKAKGWIKTFGKERIVLSLDVNIVNNEPFVAAYGWQGSSGKNLFDLINGYTLQGLRVLCTDISRDGALQGPNIDLYKNVLNKCPGVELQASGGVAGLNDLIKLKETGVHGVIVGKALYERKFTLREALSI
ncbi:Phosphoribosylformimino-5-aminoimidazole carboxamide ribotide isomerase [Elusimicrobium minutum Pei191]|uniref:1-(5-phosphoribosyl)-5-[(5-phosphoribosylamino)methylideneamino] imidazole-4-carboxamide isomerase n=1 Tax=Elusimicrobium minutum (strain Pei191) TaxID=445932 RepID=HIS4_ELUMP|nr:1-(5-phosphoribosyl)-5-[(5-phosphoribosylamino)methylideneamino]imidazole-4-carboxamide isomerase [Elusimicrobium minutum]B2KCM6.1 RecName: Full=1-(5-phosphoribosyl)-5-[(5-phosphoribosylamino)methylideneamino] imidazole-4-carboxamide isomerase; AltName: Full=Phosphoribosylformimino-5-aminoimidazole carboxamide ribotide isomerase [Elusimicrobium minutum Pei191]ACC98272.1 Phosphoribosylformimino-5-aminoimidazole carboxamide ribotide isomerase [Elusimicrobium minutum Pei191]